MSSTQPAVSIGVDFGTSNTVVALATADGHVETIRFTHDGTAQAVFASALCFWQERPGAGPALSTEGGPWAIEKLLEGETALRFVQSFKTFAASRTFQSTRIFRQSFRFEDLLVAFLRTLARHAGDAFNLVGGSVTVGRPVHFAGANVDDVLAMQRYHDAFGRLGAGHARFVYEPVGAAFSFARRLDGDATVLVADFGGGTSDFSVIRFAREDGLLRARARGHAGVGVAGDTFDSRIVDHVVAPRLGKGGTYRSFDKVLPLPNHYFGRLSRWHELAVMKDGADLRELRDLARTALEPSALRDFIALVEHDLGFPLYRAVTAAKVALSTQESVEFDFAEGGIEIRATITRADFESWIAGDLARIATSVDQAMAASNITPREVDRVFLTGGSSFVPAVQKLFAERFGQERLTAADQFESIAYGLALIGQSDNPDQWVTAA